MNADNDYKIGYQHIVCEDYSLSGVKFDGSGAYAIVSDGCSASADVDVRPDYRDHQGRWLGGTWQGRGGVRHQSRSLVFPMSLSGRSGDAWLSRA